MQHRSQSRKAHRPGLIALVLVPMLCLGLALPAGAAPVVGSTVASWVAAVRNLVVSWSTSNSGSDSRPAEASVDEGGIDIEPNG